jgi:YggT family protein
MIPIRGLTNRLATVATPAQRTAMTATDSFLAYWYFHIPNLLMAALIYTLLGRFLLQVIFKPDSEAVILKVFKSVTDPVLKLVRFITPAIVPNGVLMVFAVAWLMALRLFWFLTCVAAGMRPSIGV